ncbi:hypothetical protein EDD76_102236 [Kineothrix alysoides]|uniref:Uncharacterized protein n=1 Tax=Kineothrix alysoides TaxID=1469948 RepID=A0A4R1R522_9FIRM|nr:hypothetical protein [Kineothrix alysoides]TCL60538.1 hypothetical protein EDD76_102236 [Kineothrix alysoides]
MMNSDFFHLLYTHIEERDYNNVYQNLKHDEDYLEATKAEAELCIQFENLALSEEERDIIKKWVASIHTQNAAYSMVMFRMAMQCCFSLLMQLGNLE